MFPSLIALCGNPLSGKSTAATIISQLYGHALADDGLPLREIAINYFGLTHDQCFTQEGKLEKVMLNGREWTVREILGELGNAFEEKFGGDIIPLMTHRAYAPDADLVLGSVRREQGRFWREHGALVIEIINPLAGPSNYEFDTYNASHCHVRIQNDGLARGLNKYAAIMDLSIKLKAAIDTFGSGRR